MSHESEFSDRVLDSIEKHRLIEREDHVLVAVSGGPDSVALLHALHALSETLGIAKLTVAHFNHRLRGTASDEDAAFVRRLADELELEFLLGAEDVAAHQRRSGLSLEMAARELRRRFLLNTSTQAGAHRIALGHNANDQAEEVLLRLIRGTSPGGLGGMRPLTSEGVIRPLLEMERPEILGYLDACGFAYRNDASNFEACCDRNLLRLQVLPLLQGHLNPRVIRTLCRHADLTREEESWWDDRIQARWHEMAHSIGADRIVLWRRPLISESPVVGRRLLKQALIHLCGSFFGFQRVHLEQLLRLAASDRANGFIRLPRKIRACAYYDFFSIMFESGPTPPFQQRIEAPGTFQVAGLFVTITRSTNVPHPDSARSETGPFIAWMDDDRLRWPLTLRTWQSGDRFQPLGMTGSKKIQDLFTDLKVPSHQRKRAPILCDAEKICWVVGYRLDERVKVRSSTGNVVKVSVRPDEFLNRE